MLKIIGKQNARAKQVEQPPADEQMKDDHEEVKGENGSTGQAAQTGTRVKKSAAEIRLRKDLQELDLPSHAVINLPDQN